MRVRRALVFPVLFCLTGTLVLILDAASVSVPIQAVAACPAVTFYGDSEAQLVGNGQFTILARQSDNSYTGIQGTIGPPFPRIQTIPNFQNTLLSCGSSGGAGVGSTPAAPGVVAGAASQSFAIGDITGNSNIGAVLADNSNQVTVYQGASGLAFNSFQRYPTGNVTASVRLVDLNGDGKPDLVVVNSQGSAAGTGNISILLGSGDGTFQPAVNYKAGNTPTSVAVGDFNGDGKPDLAVANSGESDVSILISNGDGTFQAAVNVTVGSAPNSVMVADFNQDGKADLAVANGGSNNVSILLGNGDGTFQVPANFAVDADPIYVAAGDLNGDGTLDLAVANYFSNTISILLGNGDGTFRTATNYVTVSSPTSLVLTDFNSDGLLDVLVAEGTPDYILPDLTQGVLSVMLGIGKGALQAAASYSTIGSGPNPTGQGPKAIVAADINRDGKPDLVTANQSSSSLSVLIGAGVGRFNSAVNIDLQASGQSGPVALLTADFNGDLNPDLAVVSQSSSSLAILLGNGDGTFQAPVTYSFGTALINMAVGDFNGDHILDLAVVDNGLPDGTIPSRVYLLLGNGDGTFQGPVPYGVGVHPSAVVAADFNGDGKLDLAVSNGLYNSDPGGISILLGKGDGTFQPAVSYNSGAGAAMALLTGDFNNDGLPDLAAAVFTGTGPTGYMVTLFLGKPDGTFQAAVNLPTETTPVSLTLADLNRDGKPDLIVSHCCGNTDVTYMLGNGDGTFQPEVHFSAGASPESVAVADFNGDQVPDLAVADQVDNVTILLNLTPLPPPLVNLSAASLLPGSLAPESIVSAFGNRLALETATASPPLPTTLGGATVTVLDSGGTSRQAPLFYASPGQVNYEMPTGTAVGTATVTVASSEGNRVSQNVQIAQVAPSLFYFPGPGALAAAGLLRVQGNVQTPENDYQIDPTTRNIVPLPIDLGPPTDQVYIILYGTGIRNNSGLSNVSLQFGSLSEPVPVLYAGPQSVYQGLDQVNALIPRSLAGSGTVYMTLIVDGVSSNTVTITVQ